MRLMLPRHLREAILAEARRAAPRECCGLVLGSRDGDMARAQALHPARNLASRDDRFEIAPEDHFAAQRAARGQGMAVIGCYHSHPGGAARPSATDLAGAVEEDFLWLIAAPDGGGWTVAAFAYRGGELRGADLVTSSS